jgi:hypothetical protein
MDTRVLGLAKQSGAFVWMFYKVCVDEEEGESILVGAMNINRKQ